MLLFFTSIILSGEKFLEIFSKEFSELVMDSFEDFFMDFMVGDSYNYYGLGYMVGDSYYYSGLGYIIAAELNLENLLMLLMLTTDYLKVLGEFTF